VLGGVETETKEMHCVGDEIKSLSGIAICWGWQRVAKAAISVQTKMVQLPIKILNFFQIKSLIPKLIPNNLEAARNLNSCQVQQTFFCERTTPKCIHN
jgi:hypothetical protein